MTKIFCDKCGKELKHGEGAEVLCNRRDTWGTLMLSKEICEECKQEMIEWLKRKSK